MRRGLWRALAAGIALCAIAIAAAVAVLPARWLLHLPTSDSLVAVADADGSLWQGTALLALGPNGARRTLTPAIAWQWRDWGWTVTHPWLAGPLRITLGWRGASLSAQRATLPADLLSTLGAPFNTLGPAGELTASWPAMALGAALPAGAIIDVQWKNAGSALSRVYPLGDYRLRIAGGQAQTATLALTTDRGPLTLQGNGTWRNKVVFNGEALIPDAVGSGDRAAMAGLLSAIGRRSGDRDRFGTGGG